LPKELFHLPDIPNAGYATQRERELTDMIMDFMRQTERNRILLLTIVIEGKATWRKRAGDIWRGMRIGEDHQLLDSIYDYFTLQACKPRTQRLLLAAAHNAPKWREIVKIVLPHLEREREVLKVAQKWSPN
jgi:hypothetical protein